MTAEVLAQVNQKGGVGKTTESFHVCRAAVKRGMRVLAIDLDPQANLTSVTTAEPFEADQVGMADVLSTQAGESLRDVIVPGIWENFDVAPSNGPPLAAVQRELVGVAIGREQRLRAAIQPVLEDYDLIVIDCGPAMDVLTTNALVAASTVMIVSEAALFSINGLGQVLASVNEIRTYYNPGLTIAGVVVNQYRPNTVSGQAWRRELLEGVEAHGVPLIQPIIPHRAAIQDSMEAAMGLDEWKGSPAAAIAAGMYDRHLDSIIINEGVSK